MTLADKKVELLAQLGRGGGVSDRLARLMARARSQAPLEAAWKTKQFQVSGCLSRLWIVPEFREGCCHFRCDSDSQVVKSIAGLLCEFYSGHAPEEILTLDPSFLAEAGITQHLTPNRRNALSRVWDIIRAFAESQARASVP